MAADVSDVVEDPESYNNYISRLNDKRKNAEKFLSTQRSKAGSGFLWNDQIKFHNRDYDYTKHQYSQLNILAAKVSLKNNNI